MLGFVFVFVFLRLTDFLLGVLGLCCVQASSSWGGWGSSLAVGHAGVRSCVSWASVALQHVGCSWTGNRTRVSCLGRPILYH